MIKITFITLVLLAASGSAYLASRSSRRREKALRMVRGNPSLPTLSWSAVRREFSGKSLAVSVGRLRYPLAIALCLIVLAITANPFLALLPFPALMLLKRTAGKSGNSRGSYRKDEQVLEMIDSLNQSLRSGLSLHQSLEVACDDVGEELRGVLLEVLKDISLGTALEAALSSAASASTSPSLKLTFTVLGLLHGKGGDLPLILDRLRKRVSEGLEARREARILTSQSRASGYLVSALPAVFLLLQAALNPQSLGKLLRTPTGNLIIVAAAGLNAAAFLLIRKIVEPGA